MSRKRRRVTLYTPPRPRRRPVGLYSPTRMWTRPIIINGGWRLVLVSADDEREATDLMRPHFHMRLSDLTGGILWREDPRPEHIHIAAGRKGVWHRTVNGPAYEGWEAIQ